MKIVGYTTGVYDLFHIGHLRLLQRARAACDELIVGVTTDELSLQRKNKTPIIPFAERIEIISQLKCVSSAVPQSSMDKLAAWNQYKFNKMFVGDDWKGSDKWTEMESSFSSLGVEIVYFPYTQHTSSTMLRAALSRLMAN